MEYSSRNLTPIGGSWPQAITAEPNERTVDAAEVAAATYLKLKGQPSPTRAPAVSVSDGKAVHSGFDGKMQHWSR
jgi:hypothetical protein